MNVEENCTWRADLVHDTFLPSDADVALNIPIQNGGGEDFFACGFENLGIYSVKLVYHALMNKKMCTTLKEGAATATSQSNEQMWTSLWKLKVVPKLGSSSEGWFVVFSVMKQPSNVGILSRSACVMFV